MDPHRGGVRSGAAVWMGEEVGPSRGNVCRPRGSPPPSPPPGPHPGPHRGPRRGPRPGPGSRGPRDTGARRPSCVHRQNSIELYTCTCVQ
jgi:hypothetical protein